MEQIRFSVAMATYNGEKYIKEQLDSILKQLNSNDEIIISDDGSTDNTINLIKSYNDKRIKIIPGPKKGIIKNFENAISNCNGKYIVLSDQDDIWLDNKIETLLKYFEKYDCILHDCFIVNSDNSKIIFPSFFEFRNSKIGIFRNIMKNSYIGCCMAFKSDFKKYILPIPTNIEMHDQWIGLCCEKFGNVCFIKEKLINYRRHKDTATNLKHNSLLRMIKNRFNLIININRIKEK